MKRSSLDRSGAKRPLAVLATIFLSCGALGQTVSPSQAASQPQPAYSAIPQLTVERKTLVLQLAALYQSGATTKQIVAWHQQNDAQLENLSQQIQASMPASDSSMTRPAVIQNVSPTTQEFFANRQLLSASLANLYQQNANSITLATIRQWRQNNAVLINRQVTLEQSLQQPSSQPLKFVAAQIPPNVSPQVRAYTTLRNQLSQEETALLNNYLTAGVATRDAAVTLWHQQNAVRFQQLQNLPPPPSSSPTKTGASP